MTWVDRRFLGLAAAGLAVLSLNVCGGGSDSSSGPTGPTVPGGPVTPTPAPTPTPEPTLSASCAALPAGDLTASCPQEVASFQDEVDSAIRNLQAQRPDLFDASNVVQSVGQYYVELIKILDSQGLCAYFDGEELGVADSSEFNDQYDILSAKNIVRIGSKTYRSTCRPSAIPIPQAPRGPSPPGCSLAPSREVACSRDAAGPQFYYQVEAAIDHVLENRPELFDFNDTATRTDWPRIRDLEAYQQAIADDLTAQGFCAKSDRLEEIAVKNENARSEQYDVQLADNYVRRGSGIYRATCYPAAF
jgi:hypothetical protein